MPYYEFECKKCGKQFTHKQSFEQHDKHVQVKCPACHSKQVEQLVSLVGVKTSKKS